MIGLTCPTERITVIWALSRDGRGVYDGSIAGRSQTLDDRNWIRELDYI